MSAEAPKPQPLAEPLHAGTEYKVAMALRTRLNNALKHNAGFRENAPEAALGGQPVPFPHNQRNYEFSFERGDYGIGEIVTLFSGSGTPEEVYVGRLSRISTNTEFEMLKDKLVRIAHESEDVFTTPDPSRPDSHAPQMNTKQAARGIVKEIRALEAPARSEVAANQQLAEDGTEVIRRGMPMSAQEIVMWSEIQPDMNWEERLEIVKKHFPEGQADIQSSTFTLDWREQTEQYPKDSFAGMPEEASKELIEAIDETQQEIIRQHPEILEERKQKALEDFRRRDVSVSSLAELTEFLGLPDDAHFDLLQAMLDAMPTEFWEKVLGTDRLVPPDAHPDPLGR